MGQPEVLAVAPDHLEVVRDPDGVGIGGGVGPGPEGYEGHVVGVVTGGS
jgi:hypothetical protein